MAYSVSSMNARCVLIAGFLALLTLLASCAEDPAQQSQQADPATGQPETPAAQGDQAPDVEAWMEESLALCGASLAAFSDAVSVLDETARALPESTRADDLTNARQAWRDTLSAWGSASLCLHEPLPGTDPEHHRERLALTAAAPAMAGFIDSIPGYSYSGLVHDETLNLSADNLRRQHQVTDDAEVALGLYALEVVLFGDPARQSDDFARPTEGSKQPGARRSKLLNLQLDELVEQNRQWQNAWEDMRLNTGPRQATAMLNTWSLSLDELSGLARQLGDGRMGLAQTAEHDQLLVTARLSTLKGWWTSERTLEQVDYLGLDRQQWSGLGDELNAAADSNAAWLEISRTAETASRLLSSLHTGTERQL